MGGEGSLQRAPNLHFRLHACLAFPHRSPIPIFYCSRLDIFYKYFFALARTRVSNTELRIVVCAVWNGFNIAYATPSRLPRVLSP
jgi:hypothetical protein